MAFTDFGTGIITQSLYVVLNFDIEEDDFKLIDMTTWPRMYSILKQMVDGLGNYFVILTVLTITTMSIERWLHISYRSLVTVRRAYIAVGVLLPLPIPLAVCRALYPFNIAVNVTSAFFLLFCLVITSVAYVKVFRIIRAKRCSTSNPHGQVQKICLHHSLYCCHIHYLLLAHGHFFLGFNASSLI